MEELRGQFRPEFLNRVDEIIVFRPLSRDQIGHIVEIQLGRLRKLLAERRLNLDLTPEAQAALSEEGYDPIYGARPLKRVIQQRIQNPLALELLQGRFHEGDTIVVDTDADGNFTFESAGVASAAV
jgi:ATP-dependent Clp protease ATP-binding subunit ClpB